MQTGQDKFHSQTWGMKQIIWRCQHKMNSQERKGKSSKTSKLHLNSRAFWGGQTALLYYYMVLAGQESNTQQALAVERLALLVLRTPTAPTKLPTGR